MTSQLSRIDFSRITLFRLKLDWRDAFQGKKPSRKRLATVRITSASPPPEKKPRYDDIPRDLIKLRKPQRIVSVITASDTRGVEMT